MSNVPTKYAYQRTQWLYVLSSDKTSAVYHRSVVPKPFKLLKHVLKINATFGLLILVN